MLAGNDKTFKLEQALHSSVIPVSWQNVFGLVLKLRFCNLGGVEPKDFTYRVPCSKQASSSVVSSFIVKSNRVFRWCKEEKKLYIYLLNYTQI